MAVVLSTTFPGTPIRLGIESCDTFLGSTAFDVAASSAGSDVWSRPRRYPDFDPVAAVLVEVLDPPDISELRQSVAKNGAAEITDLWILDEQAARLGIHIQRR